MNKLVSKFCMVGITFVFLTLMMPVIAFANEANLIIPSMPRNDLFYLGFGLLAVISIGIPIVPFLYFIRRKRKRS